MLENEFSYIYTHIQFKKIGIFAVLLKFLVYQHFTEAGFYLFEDSEAILELFL